MPRAYDRVKDSTTTTGTGAITLSGTAPTGFQTFASRYALGDQLMYCITDSTSGRWEVGEGYLTASTTLVRDSVADGSSGPGVFVNFTAGTKDVFVTIAAHFVMDAMGGAILSKINGQAMP